MKRNSTPSAEARSRARGVTTSPGPHVDGTGRGFDPSRANDHDGPSNCSRADTAASRAVCTSLSAAGKKNPAEPADRPDLDDRDVGRLLGLVGGQAGVGRGRHFQHEQAGARHQQAALAPFVDQLRLVRADVGDELGRGDLRPDPVLLGQAEIAPARPGPRPAPRPGWPRGSPSGRTRVPRSAARAARPPALSAMSMHPEDLVARRHLDEQLGHARDGHVALTGRGDVRGRLRLHPVDEGVGPQRERGRRLMARSRLS